MFKIGCHLSITEGYLAAAKTAVSIGANTFQYFSRNPRGGSARAVDLDDIKKYDEYAAQNGIDKILAHAPYTLNACSADEKTRYFAHSCMTGDLKTMQNFHAGNMYNFHPGSHTGQGFDSALAHLTKMLNGILTPDIKTTVLLEAMSGKGSEIGVSFSELGKIIENVDNKDKIGVLIDTCHIYSGGYDIVNNLDGVLEEFDKKIGIKYLHAIHLNDSMTPFDSKKDRHELIGKGSIGLDAFARIINHKYLKDLPFYLETPTDTAGYKEEIALLKTLRIN